MSSDGVFMIHNGIRKILQLETGGLMRARPVKVDLISWSDYVFKPEYNLMPLMDVEACIKLNGHLPNIKPASEIEAYGLDLGETNKILTEKIEKLTLYLIQQHKAMEALKSEIDLLNLR